MPQDELVIRVIALFSATLLLLLLVLRARARAQPGASPMERIADQTNRFAVPGVGGAPVELQSEPIWLLWREAFGAKQFSYAILDEHQTVLQQVTDAIPEAISSRRYFPRRPQIIPRLMAALRDDDATLKQLIDIISQDPVLTGDVLRIGNSSFYRTSKEPVDTLARAVVLLGTDGLRSVIANSVMHPVFKTPSGYYERFAPMVWELASRSALAAQIWCRNSRTGNPFNAHLATLIYHISYVVLFNLTTELYQRASGSLPRPEVFTRIFHEQVDRVALLIARDWELHQSICDALAEFDSTLVTERASPLAKACRIGRLAGLGGLLVSLELLSEPACNALLADAGVESPLNTRLWRGSDEEMDHDDND